MLSRQQKPIVKDRTSGEKHLEHREERPVTSGVCGNQRLIFSVFALSTFDIFEVRDFKVRGHWNQKSASVVRCFATDGKSRHRVFLPKHKAFHPVFLASKLRLIENQRGQRGW